MNNKNNGKIIYKIIESDNDHSLDINFLNKQGKDGWIFIKVECITKSHRSYDGLDEEYYDVIDSEIYKHLFYKNNL